MYRLSTRWLPLLAASLTIALMLPGCTHPTGGTGSSQSDAGSSLDPSAVLKVWSILSEEENTVIQGILDQFADETGIRSTVEQVNIFELTPKFRAGATSGEAADIIISSHSEIGGLAMSTLIRPLDFLDASYFDRFQKLAFDAFKYKDKIYGVGYSIESYGLVYNNELVQTPPATMEDLFAEAAALTKDVNSDGRYDYYGLLFDPTNLYFTYPIYKGYGGYLFGQDTNGNYLPSDIGIDSPGSVQALEKIKEMYDKKYLPKDITIDIINNLFCKGRVAYTITGPWALDEYGSKGIDFSYVPLPPFRNGKKSTPLSTLSGFSLNNYSQYKKEADALLEYLLTDEHLTAIMEVNKLKRAPLNIATYDSPYIQEHEDLKAITDIAYGSEPFPNLAEARTVWTYFTNGVLLALKGDKTCAEALTEIRRNMEIDIQNMQE